jgi:hypothetical protein
MKEHVLTTFITHLLVLIYQKKKNVVEIAAQIDLYKKVDVSRIVT